MNRAQEGVCAGLAAGTSRSRYQAPGSPEERRSVAAIGCQGVSGRLAAARRRPRVGPPGRGNQQQPRLSLFAVGGPTRAENQLRHTLGIAPERVPALMNLADLLAHEGASAKQLQEAAELMQRARQIAGNDATLIIRQARIEAKRARFQSAERLYKQLMTVQPVDDPLATRARRLLPRLGPLRRRAEVVPTRGPWQRAAHTGDAPHLRAGGGPRGAALWMGARRGARFGARQGAGPARAAATQPAQGHRGSQATAAGRGPLSALCAGRTRGWATWRANAGTDRVPSWDTCVRSPFSPTMRTRWCGWPSLLAGTPRNKRVAEVAVYLQRAAELRPDWIEVRLKLAQALRAAGDPRAALIQVRRYLAETTECRSARSPPWRCRKSSSGPSGVCPRPSEPADRQQAAPAARWLPD